MGASDGGLSERTQYMYYYCLLAASGPCTHRSRATGRDIIAGMPDFPGENPDPLEAAEYMELIWNTWLIRDRISTFTCSPSLAESYRCAYNISVRN